MKYNNQDIEIFIITRNRPELAKRTVNNVLAQTIQNLSITVLDNSTDDSTEKIIKQDYPSIKYIRTEQIPLAKTPLANLEMLQKVASKTFFLLLHDDDLLNIRYVENLLSVLNKDNDIDLIAPASSHFYDVNKIDIKEKISKKYIYFGDKYIFANNCHNLSPSWSGSLTRTENFKSINLKETINSFGKIFDVPLMIKSINNGTAAIIMNPSGFFYYHHKEQDSSDNSNNLSIKQFEDYLRFFKSHIKGKDVTTCYALYLLAFSRHLNHYKWFVKNTIPYDDFMKDMYKKGIIDRKILLYSKRYKNPFYKFLTLPLKIYYGRYLQKVTNNTKTV